MFFVIIFSTDSQSPNPPEYSELDPYPFEDLITFDENRRRGPWSTTPPPAFPTSVKLGGVVKCGR